MSSAHIPVVTGMAEDRNTNSGDRAKDNLPPFSSLLSSTKASLSETKEEADSQCHNPWTGCKLGDRQVGTE